MEKDYLFVYGTLLNSDNEFGAYLKNSNSFYAKGKFHGRLYNIGEYPGAIYDESYPGYVYGGIFILNNAGFAFEVLDDYEDFISIEAEDNLFVRSLIDIETDSGVLKCWVYLFAQPTDKYQQIISGNYFNQDF
jgi:gamma-glutamylcyclotransferase (GGCT)/AIG2-like uncharacterized protein YtfP